MIVTDSVTRGKRVERSHSEQRITGRIDRLIALKQKLKKRNDRLTVSGAVGATNQAEECRDDTEERAEDLFRLYYIDDLTCIK